MFIPGSTAFSGWVTVFADLHLHSQFSDGTYSPEELAGYAVRYGLGVVALTDHDSVEGCERMAAACARRGVEFIPGTELTAELDGHELHLLGYYVDTRHPRLLGALARFQEVRQHRIREMVGRLNRLNVPLAAEAVFALANCRAPGRPHLARALVQGGFCTNLDEAFERWLKKRRPAWVPKLKMSALEAVDLIHQAGGVAVLAHPGLNCVDDLISDLVAAGMDGVECFHTKHSTATTEHYLLVAEQYGLLVTGGSDCHGMSKGKPLIGTIRVPCDYLPPLRARWCWRQSCPAQAAPAIAQTEPALIVCQ